MTGTLDGMRVHPATNRRTADRRLPDGLRAMIRSLAGGVRDRAGRSDVLLVAGALTFYALIGFVPLVVIGLRVAAAVYGRAAVLECADGIAKFAPGPLGVGDGIRSLADSASRISWWAVVATLLPLSFYAEGTVRSLERFSREPERRSRALRGRLLTLVFVAASVVAALLLVGPIRPLLTGSFGQGLGARLLGIFVAFNILFFALLGALSLVYRMFASTRIRVGPLLISAGAAASWLASQTLAYFGAIRALGSVSRAYGGFGPAGLLAALAFLAYLENVVVLFGYVLALRLHEEGLTGGPARVRPARRKPVRIAGRRSR